MPFNGSGTFTTVYTYVAGTTITVAQSNGNNTDIAANGLSLVLVRDGQAAMTGQLKIVAGSATAPGVGFSSDTNTGIYRRGADQIGFTTAGVAAGYFDSDKTFYALGDASIAGDLSVTGSFAISGALELPSTLEVDGAVTFNSTLATGAITGTSATFSGVLASSSTGYWTLPVGTTGQRPASQVAGRTRFNSTTGFLEFDNGTSWPSVSTAQPISAGFRNLVLTNNSGTPNTQYDINADAVTVETSTGVAYRLSSVDLTCNLSTAGANGLDTGSIATSTGYFFFVIYNPATATTASLASTSATSPTLPSGYTAFARFGWNRTNGSSQLARVLQKNNKAQYVVSAAVTTALPTIASGSSGSVTVPTWTASSVSSVAPSTAISVSVFATAQNGNTTMAAPNNLYGSSASTTNTPPVVNQNATGGAAVLTVVASLCLESSNIYYAASAASCALFCLGWEDAI